MHAFRAAHRFVAHRGLHSSRPLWLAVRTQNLPPLGDSIVSGYINEWLVSEGDYVETDQVITVIDTDKVSVEIRAPVSGVIVKRHVTEIGAEIDVDAPLADIEEQARPDGATQATAQPAPADPPPAAPAQVEIETVKPAEVVAMGGSDEGVRTPLIKFRYGRVNAESGVGVEGSSGSSVVGAMKDGKDSAAVSSDGRKVYDFLELPEHYGRLPPMTEDESERLLLGGADPY